MLDKNGFFIVYRVALTDNTFFNVDFEYKKNAQKYCDFLSKRDNKKYYVRKSYLAIGIPEYKDEEVLKILAEIK